MEKPGVFGAALAVGMAILGGTALAAGDPAVGKKVFRKCVVCHSPEEGRHSFGPSLFGVVGRKAGTIDGFPFSPAMKNSGVTWNERTLDRYLENPGAFIKGVRMRFPGLPSREEREDLIAYLKTLR